MIADFLYELVPKEMVGAPVLERFTDLRSVTTAGIQNSLSWRVNGDRICQLHHAFLLATTAGVATIARTTMYTSDDGGNIVCQLHSQARYPTDRSDDGALNTNNVHRNLLTTPLWLMPGEGLNILTTYSAALAGNSLETYLLGWMMPRGNVQFGSLPRV